MVEIEILNFEPNEQMNDALNYVLVVALRNAL
uniref:Uncharacterized protein n=1 Tax=Arundo donax TaxID=35708 RepID=A0A0A8ZBG4_ARUDO